MAVADVNGDGAPDALTANTGSRKLSVLLNAGSGRFSLQLLSPATGAGSEIRSVAVADVNGDGTPDVLETNLFASPLDVLLNDGNGNFTLQANSLSTGAGSNPNSVALADVNRDGKVDALVANQGTNTLGVLLGNGSGGFTLQANGPSSGPISFPQGVVVADVNGDGQPDALVANYSSNTLGVFLNNSPLLPARAALPGTRVSVYPNPAREYATLAVTGLPAAATKVQATLLAATGRVLGHHTLSANGGSIPLAGLAPGLYFVRLAAQDAQGRELGALPMQQVNVW